MANIHYVNHTGANKRYFERVLDSLEIRSDINVRRSGLTEFLEQGHHDEDILCYQTFPDENLASKFNPNLVAETDKLFYGFRGHKILIDTFDNGEEDAFSRFPKSKILPRVKCFPSERFMEDYNVILLSTISIKEGSIFPDEVERTVRVSCKFGMRKYQHMVRHSVIEQLEKFFPNLADRRWIDGRTAYESDMKRTLIAIGAPGWGQYSSTHQLALRTGALLFAYDSFNDIRYLPHANMRDGKDFVSYNLFNFRYKLQWLLDNPKRVDQIRKSGRAAFKRGYSPKKTADQFYKYLHKKVV